MNDERERSTSSIANDRPHKLTHVRDIVSYLEKRGVIMTPNAVRARLQIAMRQIADLSCTALGIDVDPERLDRVGASRAFQEAIASVVVPDEDRG